MDQDLPDLSRRGFFASGAALGLATAAAPAAALPAARTPLAAALAVGVTAPAAGAGAGAGQGDPDAEALRWLDGTAPAEHAGLTWGWPWARGACPAGSRLALQDGGRSFALQSWPLAYWPDGSLKWSGHALPPGLRPGPGARVQVLAKGATALAGPVLTVEESADAVTVDTGVVRCVLPRRGGVLVASVQRAGRETLRRAVLVAQVDDRASPEGHNARVQTTAYLSELQQLTVEQRGPARAVVRLQGRHQAPGPGGRAWLPFDLRVVLYAGGESLRVVHSFVFDGDPQQDFIRGLGLRFEVPLSDALHDRHVRFAGEGTGLWAEAVRGLTGLRRDPGAAVRAAQLAGQACPPRETWHKSVHQHLERIPAWGDHSLLQLGPDNFQIRKRTQAGQSWVHAAWGRRAAGLGYVGGVGGGVAFGLRDFWQRHPTQLDIRQAHTEAAQVTLWLHSPEAPALDLRPYHDGLGMDTFAKQLEGLEVTYEDWEPGFDTPVGVGRSSELTLHVLAATPSRERLVALAQGVQQPPLLVASPQRYLSTQVQGRQWGLPDRSTPAKAAIEDRLDFLFDFYQRETEQRRWTGFLDYGDVRHTYDADRHEWRYDVGGYAWDNSELSPDLWLWQGFLRSGRADVFRYAEAMVRHTSEVDTYHLGRFAGLGTRHGVQHWSDSAKQLRISNAAYRRLYHYLTADERIGDVLDSLRTADRQLLALDPGRKLPQRPDKGGHDGLIGVGTDWGSLLAAWLTAWERTGDVQWRNKILRGMESVGRMPHGFFSAATAGYDAQTGELFNMQGQRVGASHLSAVFGLVEVVGELLELLNVPAFEAAWLQYCRLYNAPVDQQRRELGAPHGAANALPVGHSRLTAYAAWRSRDTALAQRAWREFHGDRRFGQAPLRTQRVQGPAVLNPVEEAPWISTNDAAQWGLAAIQNLALIGEHLPAR